MIDLNKLAQELHEAAVAKGFWDVEDAEIKHIAKMHSELSEALQEDRCGRPMLYVDDIEVEARITDPAMFDGRKPEGVAAELADFVMMLLDMTQRHGKLDLNDMTDAYRDQSRKNMSKVLEDMPLHLFVLILHKNFVFLLFPDLVYVPHIMYPFGFVLYGVELWLEQRGIDLWQVIRLKMEYNRSRPALHGRLY